MQLVTVVLLLFSLIGYVPFASANKLGKKQGVSSTPQLAADIVTIQILFNYKNTPFKVEMYEVPLEMVLDVATHSVIANDKPSPFVRPMPNEFRMRRGDTRYFAMIVKNMSSEPYYFYASYHHLRPEESAVGYVMNCLCINKLFRVPPGHTWYRIGSVNLAPTFIGNFLAVRHDIFGLTQRQVIDKKVEGMISK